MPLFVDERFKKGLELFKSGEYFESHEIIEDLWLATPKDDPYRDLYKGVIQAAAAIYQWDRKIYSGALGLQKSSIQYLKKYSPKSLGLNVDKLVRDMRKCFDKSSEILIRPKLEFSFKCYQIKPHKEKPKKYEHPRRLGKSS